MRSTPRVVLQEPRATEKSERKNLTLSLVVSSLGLLSLWALLEPYRLIIERHIVKIPQLPESWKGKRVALISDLHVGMWFANTVTVKRAVKRIIAERPAVVLIAGDFVHGVSEGVLKQVTTLLRPLSEAGLSCYAVLGNHDYDMPEKGSEKSEKLARRLERRLEAIRIRVLHNEVVKLTLYPEPLYLVGLAAHTPDKSSPTTTIANVPDGAARLVLMHHPSSFASLPPYSAPLALAGHTHGGQICLPGVPSWRFLGKHHKDEVLTSGWIKDYGAEGNNLYVTQGIGFSVLPLRLNCPPELTVFTLT
jgi:uncharacterized protein